VPRGITNSSPRPSQCEQSQNDGCLAVNRPLMEVAHSFIYCYIPLLSSSSSVCTFDAVMMGKGLL